MYVVGIDGCRDGWAVASLFDDGKGMLDFYPTLRDLLKIYPNANQYWIDMPMGLSEGGLILRDVDQYAREFLKPGRTSTIFTPPCREAVYANSYEEAKQLNIKVEGKSISIQAWNLVPKIRELDQLLQAKPHYRQIIFEAHPEICFRFMNGGDVLQSKKTTVQGINERIQLLKKLMPDVEQLLESNYESGYGGHVKIDDWLDALIIGLSARSGEKMGMKVIQGTYNKDRRGIPMRIVYSRAQTIPQSKLIP